MVEEELFKELKDRLHFFLRLKPQHTASPLVLAEREYARKISKVERARERFKPHHQICHNLRIRYERLEQKVKRLEDELDGSKQEVLMLLSGVFHGSGHRHCYRHRGKIYLYTEKDILDAVDKAHRLETEGGPKQER